MDKILLIDTLNSIYRASTSFGPPIKHIQSEDLNYCKCKSLWDQENNDCYGNQYLIVFNFFRNLKPLVELFSPDKIFFCLEGSPQFRYDLYPEYKANRIIKTASKKDIKDKVLSAQSIILELLKYLQVTFVKANQYECDDVIATLSENLKDEEIIIISNDSDYIQLLQKDYKSINIYNPIKKEFMIAPNYPYIAWKSLAGDKSDNIPSLVKPQQAINFMNDPNLFEKFLFVEESRANFSINKQLIEFRQIPEEELIFTEGNSNFSKLKQEFDKMKFTSITNDKSWEKYTLTFNCLKF